MQLRALIRDCATCILGCQVEERVRANADWLFKCVGAAHAVLGDPAQRAELDADLDARAKGRSSYYARPSGGYGSRCALRPSSLSQPAAVLSALPFPHASAGACLQEMMLKQRPMAVALQHSGCGMHAGGGWQCIGRFACRTRSGQAGSQYRPSRWDPPGPGGARQPAGFGERWYQPQSDESDSDEGFRPFY